MARTRPHVLIAGGGVAALEAALALRALAEDRVSVTLMAPEPYFWYRPMAVAEPFRLGEARHFELSHLAIEAGATFVPGALVSVDTDRYLAFASPGGAVPYSKLLIACGTTPRPAIEGAIAFRGPADTERIAELLVELETGAARRVAFVVPAGAVWSLPAYELALMTAEWARAHGLADVEISIVTPESEPLHLFGREASDAVRTLLEERGIAVHADALAAEARDGELLLVPEGVVVADRVVALPRLQGPRIGGIPQTFEGFIPVDVHGRVTGLEDVYAAGDITTFPVKQGGIAAQQAEAAAEAIAAGCGAELRPEPFRPVLRGILLTGSEPRYLRGELEAGALEPSQASTEPLWWPPAKIVGRYLSPFLARTAGLEAPTGPPPERAVPIEVELAEYAAGVRRDRALRAAADALFADSGAGMVAEVMTGEPLVVEPEDTLGEIAELLEARGGGAALVAEAGRLIGILTVHDLLRAVAGRVHPAEARARQWMTAEPVVVTPETSLETASLLMAEHDLHRLPVVEGDRPLGLVGIEEVRAAMPIETGIGLGF